MIVPLYLIENYWCYLEVSIKNNCYWIDWNVIIDNNNNEIKDKNKINLDYLINKNVLCLNNFYYYFNTYNKKIFDFNNNFNFMSVDGTNSLSTLNNLKNIYENFDYNINL